MYYKTVNIPGIIIIIFFFRKGIWVLLELVHSRTQNFTKIDQEKHKNKQYIHLEPHDYCIYDVDIDLRQTFFQNVCTGEEQGEMAVFGGYRSANFVFQSLTYKRQNPRSTTLDYNLWPTASCQENTRVTVHQENIVNFRWVHFCLLWSVLMTGLALTSFASTTAESTPLNISWTPCPVAADVS